MIARKPLDTCAHALCEQLLNQLYHQPYLCEAELPQQQLSKHWQQHGVAAQGEGHLLLQGSLLQQAGNGTSGNANTHSCRHRKQQQAAQVKTHLQLGTSQVQHTVQCVKLEKSAAGIRIYWSMHSCAQEVPQASKLFAAHACLLQ
jgi:coproporphyrinogen III oxidase